MFGFNKKKKYSDNYLEAILKCADRRGYLPFSEGFPQVPEIEARHILNTSTIFRSNYMQNIPVSDFATGAYNAMRFSFAYGVIMATVWHLDFGSFDTLDFDVDLREIETAMKALEFDKEEYEDFVKDLMDEFFEIISSKENPDPRLDLNLALSAVQTVGSAMFLKKAGFK